MSGSDGAGFQSLSCLALGDEARRGRTDKGDATDFDTARFEVPEHALEQNRTKHS